MWAEAGQQYCWPAVTEELLAADSSLAVMTALEVIGVKLAGLHWKLPPEPMAGTEARSVLDHKLISGQADQ